MAEPIESMQCRRRGSRAGYQVLAAWLLAGAAVALTGWVMHKQFSHISLHDLRAAIAAQSVPALLAALALTGMSFTALSLYDLLGARAVARQRVPATSALLAGAAANAVANTLGFHAVTGSVVRSRIYGRHGLTQVEIVRIVSLSWMSLALGFLAMVDLAQAGEWFRSGALRPLIAAIGIAGALSLFVAWLGGGHRALSLFGFTQPLPSARAALLQMFIGAVESAAAIAALYVLLPGDLAPAFSIFALGCIAAITLGVVTHVPGGVGVFEASITAMLSGSGRADLLAALLVYRMIYNILPFVVSVAVLGGLGYLRIPSVNSKADIA